MCICAVETTKVCAIALAHAGHEVRHCVLLRLRGGRQAQCYQRNGWCFGPAGGVRSVQMGGGGWQGQRSRQHFIGVEDFARDRGDREDRG